MVYFSCAFIDEWIEVNFSQFPKKKNVEKLWEEFRMHQPL